MIALTPNQQQRLLENAAAIASPSLLVIEELVDQNIRTMLRMVDGNAARLRPHLKTTKSPDVLRKMLAAGITQFKCATLSELQMALEAGATDVLLSYQPVGPNIRKLVEMVEAHRTATIGCLLDDLSIAQQLSQSAEQLELTVSVWIDIDCGMHRTGIGPGPAARYLYNSIQQLQGLSFGGLHVYDGHIRDTDIEQRRTACEEAFATVWELAESFNQTKFSVIAGGTPTFGIHASDQRVSCSPGTSLYWDVGYATIVPDLKFACAAYLLSRVISKPAAGQLCLDLGHKAVAAEGPLESRVTFTALPNAKLISQSEEHLVLSTPDADQWGVGAPLLCIPWHICPSVALYDEALVFSDEMMHRTWPITARDRRW